MCREHGRTRRCWRTLDALAKRPIWIYSTECEHDTNTMKCPAARPSWHQALIDQHMAALALILWTPSRLALYSEYDQAPKVSTCTD
jgi:hypothetical protein